MKTQKILGLLFIITLFVSACAPATQPPGFIYTVVASTQTAASWETQMAASRVSKTPTQATLRPTYTAFPTATPFVYLLTPSATRTRIPSATPTRSVRTEWPNWKTGAVIKLATGGGTNKYFRTLDGLQVIVVRKNGVALRPQPNKAIGGPMEEKGSAFTLTGIMNKNNDFGWLFVQVIAANGKAYWVGGDEGDNNVDPTVALGFYYPYLTKSPTPSITMTFTPSATGTETPLVIEETAIPSPTLTPRP